MESITFGVLTVSDTCYKEPVKDLSGPRLMQLIQSAFDNVQIISNVLPDERDLIQRELRKWIDKEEVRVIITTGGTGFSQRDVTPEATKPLLDKDCNQLTMAIALSSLKNTKFAALSRGVCGISGSTLILNFPGSEKAVTECFETVRDILPHALQLLKNDVELVARTHAELQAKNYDRGHVCPHKTGAGDDTDRNSPYPMISVQQALDTIFITVARNTTNEQKLLNVVSPINIPPFRASIKDGYAMKSTGFSGTKRVLGCIAAGDAFNVLPIQEDECFKINTGAPLPDNADCVVQIEDTKSLQRDDYGMESLVEMLVEPKAGQDVRPIGYDLKKGDKLFPTLDNSPVVIQSLLASVGTKLPLHNPKIAILSTGSELLTPDQAPVAHKIFDSNTTMLMQLLHYFGFDCAPYPILPDDHDTTYKTIEDLCKKADIIICSGGVSMGDRDYIKLVLETLRFKVHFGRVNMKPGKPMTFASKGQNYFFGLPGNPVSAFVTFHLFALPAVRWSAGWPLDKCTLPAIQVKLLNDALPLDPRPEYVRASVTSKNGQLFASVNGDQISSRLQSIVGADVLVQLPARSATKQLAKFGDIYTAYCLRHDFISKYK